ncbi:MAG: hypothetical protein IKW00_05610 [Clostridia bacterium]|nr:hypothetical protein [Clostridia bacterium]
MTHKKMSAVLFALRRIEKLCCSTDREDLPPAAGWLRDNARMLYTAAMEAKGNKDCRKKEYARLHAFCTGLLQENEGRLNERMLYHGALDAQGSAPFTISELKCMEHMLRTVLLEMLLPLLPVIENECHAYEGGKALAASMARGEEGQIGDHPVQLYRALEILTESGDVRGAKRLEMLMQEREWQPRAIMHLAQETCMRTAEQIGNLIGSVRLLPRMDFARMTEKLSVSCHILLQESTFRRMDRSSRGLYLTAVERISRRTGEAQERICETALNLAKDKEGAEGESGYYLLVAPGLILKQLGHGTGMTEFLRAHALKIHIGLLLLSALIFGAAGIFLLPWWGVLPFALVGVSLARQLLQLLSLRITPDRRLPRLQERELKRSGRTLVVVPTILPDAHHALRMVRQLSVIYLANRAAPLDFMLLGDFTDADSPVTVQDEDVLQSLEMGIRALNDTYGLRFYAMHRKRVWDEGEGKYVGSERKRGALLTLCRLLCGEKCYDDMALCTLPPEALHDRYRYVITLDSDTFLPAGAAEKMILTIMHPLQRGRHHVLQPRMMTLPMHVHTRAQRYLGGMSGMDSYESGASDFYQDVFGRGSYMGKGIFEPRAFLRATENLPAGRILSHDLIEGEKAHSAQVNDIVCFDGHPRTLAGFLKRIHRWTRGDWQLLPFLRDQELSALSRFKIFDNLLRSLLPLVRICALTAAAVRGSWIAFIIALWPIGRVCAWAFLPAFAAAQTDAAVRALYRLFVSRKKLLQWTTAEQADRSDLKTLWDLVFPMIPGAAMVFASAFGVFIPGFALGALWLTYPLWKGLFDRPWKQKKEIQGEDRAFLMQTAADTLRFFREYVNEKTHFLPPDNVQFSPPGGVAMRTSPTNIGMYLLSLCAARKLELMDSDEMLTSMLRTVETLEKLEKWHGNFYNWYDLEGLAPLHPRFVSSVDAGNCHVCLLAAAQCARRYMHEGDKSVRDVPRRLDRLCRDMQLHRMYDRREELFHIGYEDEQDKMTEGHYDLMASEALLLSYTAIAAGQVSEKHWWRLDRTFTKIKGGKALLSWSGTMFEYMLPALLLPGFSGSLMDAARRGCVKAQIRHVSDGPFGISESGYARFDENLHYAYKAFGVPELSLSGGCSDAVRAPYAAALALLTHPGEAAAALKAWKARGVYGPCGFFEAEDFSSGEIPHIVCSHMAHHQGMILCAVCNALCEEGLPSLLFALPRLRAHLPLLNERAPDRVLSLPKPLRARRDEVPKEPLQLKARDGLPPDMHVLSGKNVTFLQSARGQGYIAEGDILLTRFDPRPAALSGPQFYLHDVKENASVRLTGGEYLFRDGEWRVTQSLGNLKSTVSGCVDPMTGAVIYRVRVRNLTENAVRTELTSYMEPALESAKKDSAHLAFSNLFLSAEASGVREFTLRRRLREGGERIMRFRALTAGSGQTLMMNDRSLFIGRTGNLEEPRGLTLPEEQFVLSDTVEPCATLRMPLVIPGGREETLYFALGTGELPENGEQAQRASLLCASRSAVMADMLKTDARQRALLCRAAGHFLFSGLPGEREAASVSTLWTKGVSGDRPFALIKVSEMGCEAVLRQTLRLLASLFEHGVQGEAILLLPEEGGYEQPLRSLCETLLLRPAFRALRGRARIFYETEEEFLRAARALCALEIDCGTELKAQLEGKEAPVGTVISGEGGTLPSIARLKDFNGWGGFTSEDGYSILPAANGGTPAPWSYMICSDRFGTLLCEQGILYTHAGNSRLRRITAAYQDSVSIAPSEEYFITENGCTASVTKADAPGESYRVTFETGTAVYERAFGGLHISLHCFTDLTENAGYRILTVKNTGSETHHVALHAAVRFAMGEDGRGTECAAQGACIMARGGNMEGCGLFAAAEGKAHTAAESVYAPALGVRVLDQEENGTVGVIRQELKVKSGETKETVYMIGWCAREQDAPRIRSLLLFAKEKLRQVRGYWDERLRKLSFYLPDEGLSRYLNSFLPYQIRASRLMMRAGFYQSGGAYGFRDQLQDMLPLLYTEPERVREHLLLCASRQYVEGDVQHWWHPGGAGVRTRISDDLLFLPYVTARYVQVTGDGEILKAHAAYLESQELTEEEHDRYEMALSTRETGTLMEHCLKAINRVKTGEKGIPLMGGGDWNDGMDRVKGESAWLGFFYRMVLRDFAPLCGEKEKKELLDRAARLEAALRTSFRDKWFIRAWYEDGRSIGAWDSEVPRIDLISQCFAAFAGMPRSQVTSGLDQAYALLHKEEKGITCLMAPPFTTEEEAGYIGAYLPGVRENGGQYTHAVPWFMRALLQNGRKDRAWQLLQEILPYNHAHDVSSVRHYRTEPYALPADVYRWGRGGWTWYTGSAAWLYEVFLRDFLGFDKRGNEVKIAPCLPDAWDEVTVVYRFGASVYYLTATGEAKQVTLDGAFVRGEYILLTDDGRTHEAKFPCKE